MRDSNGRFIKGNSGYWAGKKLSLEIRKRMRVSHLGKKLTKETKRKVSQNNAKYWLGKKRLHMTGDKHPQWKGDKVGYYAWHSWAERQVGKADRCINVDCIYPRKDARGKIMLAPQGYHLSCVSGLYLRDIKDIQMLCISCHMKYDIEHHWGTIDKIFKKDRTGSPSVRI